MKTCPTFSAKLSSSSVLRALGVGASGWSLTAFLFLESPESDTKEDDVLVDDDALDFVLRGVR
jgi:hypothetical protein